MRTGKPCWRAKSRASARCRTLPEPGTRRDARLLGKLDGNQLVAHGLDRFGRRAYERQSFRGAQASELGALRQEAVARVDGIAGRAFGRRHEQLGPQIAVTRRRRADADGARGQAGRKAAAIRLGHGHHAFEPQRLAGVDHAHRDLAAVGDQDALERPRRHQLRLLAYGCNEDQHLVELDEAAVLGDNFDDLAVDPGPDRIEELHHLDQAHGVVGAHPLALLHERFLARRRRAVEGAQHRRADGDHAVGHRHLGRARRRGNRCRRANATGGAVLLAAAGTLPVTATDLPPVPEPLRTTCRRNPPNTSSISSRCSASSMILRMFWTSL